MGRINHPPSSLVCPRRPSCARKVLSMMLQWPQLAITGKTCYDGHPVLPVVISCFNDSKEEEARQQDVMAYFNSAGVQALKTNEAMITLKKEYRFLMEHIDRRSHFLSFCKCSRKTCHHCRTQPVTSKRSMKLMQESCGIFTPTPDPSHLGHFKTFWQMAQDIIILKQPAEVPDAFLPRDEMSSDVPLSCDHCRYVFNSSADYRKIAHGCSTASKPKRHVCGYNYGSARCTLEFPTYYAMLKQKSEAGHKSARGRPKKK